MNNIITLEYREVNTDMSKPQSKWVKVKIDTLTNRIVK